MRSECRPLSVADAIVVLGAAVWPNGEPSPTLKRRTLHAANLYRSGAAPLVVLSGGTGKHPPAEAEVMASLCTGAGVDAAALIVEDRSTTTFENVAFSAEILRALGLSKVLVVSDAYHLPRAKMCFRYLGFETIASVPPNGAIPTRRRRIVMSWLRELVALPWYRLTIRRQMHTAGQAGQRPPH